MDNDDIAQRDVGDNPGVTGALSPAEQAQVPPIKPGQPLQAHHPQPLGERPQGNQRDGDERDEMSNKGKRRNFEGHRQRK